MTNKLYVGNLPYSSTQEELGEIFTEAGEVISVRIITDRQTGRSRGFGFVEMSSPEEAETAVEKINGHDMGGRSLRVDLARGKPGGPEGDDRGGY